MRALRARGFDVEHETTAPDSSARGYDLARHRGMLGQIAMLAGAGVYALVDTFFVLGYEPLGPLPIVPFAVAGGLGLLVVSVLGRGAPRTERLGVGAFAIAAIVAAAYPATLRLNASTAEPETVTYVSWGARAGSRRPRLACPRSISPDTTCPNTGPNSRRAEHEFTLLRGTSDFYQLALEPFYERTRRFYGARTES